MLHAKPFAAQSRRSIRLVLALRRLTVVIAATVVISALVWSFLWSTGDALGEIRGDAALTATLLGVSSRASRGALTQSTEAGIEFDTGA